MSLFFRTATPADLDLIFQIELESFPEGIREKKELFLERINTFPEGFLLLFDDLPFANGSGFCGTETEQTAVLIGYIASEIWNLNRDPISDDFCLGHSIKETHSPKGNLLYISSMGVRYNSRGNGYGKKLFKELLHRLSLSYPSLAKTQLIVGVPWIAARKVYTEDEFKERFFIKDFFCPTDTPPFDGVVMERPYVRNSSQ